MGDTEKLRKIKSISELPKWFKLGNYEAARDLDLAGWVEQLVVRRDVWLRVDNSATEERQANTTGIATVLIMEALPKIRAKPIIDISQDELLKACFSHGALAQLKKESNYSRSVRLVTGRDIYTTEQRITEEKRDEARRYFALIPDVENHSKELFRDINENWMDFPIDHVAQWRGEKLMLLVDPLVSKEVMLRQLEEMLEPFYEVLKYEGISVASRRSSNFSEWIRFGVLPYCDLQTWARENNLSIPNRVMADAIFPPGEGGDEVVRKTTFSYAEELLSPSFLQTLSAEAALEKAERNSNISFRKDL